MFKTPYNMCPRYLPDEKKYIESIFKISHYTILYTMLKEKCIKSTK